MTDVKQKVFSGVIWRFLERFGAQIVSFVVSVILARLLEPEYYGQISLVMIIANVLQVLIDSGFGSALIQKQNADDIDFSTVFYFNLLVCILLYFILFVSAPIISKFYGTGHLTTVIRAIGIIIIISGIKNVQQAYVSKHMLFEKFFYSTLSGTIIAAFIAIIMAYNSFGIWALVAQYVINPLIDTIILWITVKWRPVLKFSFERLKSLYSFGWKLLIVSLLNEIFNDVRGLVIGKIYSVEDLAFYNNGQKVPQLLTQNIDTSIRTVIFPALANEQNNLDLVKVHMLKTIKISGYILFPVLFGMAACGKQIVLLLWTEKWIQSVSFLQIMCVALAINSIQATNQQTLIALGYSNKALQVEILIKVISFFILFLTLKISVVAIAIGVVIATFMALFVNLWPNKKILNCSITEQIFNILPELTISFVMAIVVWSFGKLVTFPVIVTFVCQVLLGVVIYVYLSVLFKMTSFTYVKSLLSSFLQKNTNKGKN